MPPPLPLPEEEEEEKPLPRRKPEPKPPKPKPTKRPRPIGPLPQRDGDPGGGVATSPPLLFCGDGCSGPCAYLPQCQPPPPPSPGATVRLRSSRLPTPLVALSASLLTVSAVLLLALLVHCLVARRRRAQGAPLAHHAETGGGQVLAGAVAQQAGAGGEGEDEEAAGGGVHHVWYIRTKGLDERAISAIAAVVYDAKKRGAGASSDGGGSCAVCLAEFRHGETLRLLPRCAHAFHRACIDTWLRAHVNCPICRSPVVVIPSDLPVGAAEAEAGGDPSGEHHAHEEMSLSQSESETEGSEDYEDSSSTQSDGTTATAEENGSATPKPIRRSASMDSPLFLVAVPEAQDDVMQYNCKLPNAREMKVFRVKEKEAAGTSSTSCQSGRFKIGRSMSSSGQGFFFSRNGRSSGAVLPL